MPRQLTETETEALRQIVEDTSVANVLASLEAIVYDRAAHLEQRDAAGLAHRWRRAARAIIGLARSHAITLIGQ